MVRNGEIAMNRSKVGNTIYDIVVNIFVTFILIITLYPFVYVISMSISDPMAVVRGDILLFPVGFDLSAYKTIFSNKDIWRYYYNTIWYTGVGTSFNVVFTVLMAYPLSKKHFFAKNFFTIVIIITMFFSGGLIPSYILVVKLGLYNTRWALIFPVLMSAWNVIISRTFFSSLPEELFESARIEGASEFKVLIKIVIPLSKPILAVLTLFYGVAHWNSFFSAMLYLPNADLHPIQIYLRRILLQSSQEMASDSGLALGGALSMMQVKYALIVVAIFPIVVLYPFLQKYFVKGVMIGALKG